MNSMPVTPEYNVVHQLHSFSDSSSSAFGSVVYIRRIVNGVPVVAIVFGKSKVVLRHQQTWPIARKELVADARVPNQGDGEVSSPSKILTAFPQ